MKKLLVLLLVIMAAVLFASCRDDTSSNNDHDEQYSAGYTAYISRRSDQSGDNLMGSDEVSSNETMLHTYTQILVSNTILSETAKAVDSNLSIDELKSMVKAEVVEDSEIIRVTVCSDDPKDAYVFANAHARTAPKYIAEIVEGSSMKIVDYPVYSE